MAVTCDAQSLVTNSACLDDCVPSGYKASLLISIYCSIAHVACDPQTLVNNATQIEWAIPDGMKPAVLIYLMQQIAGGATASLSAQQLAQLASCDFCQIPPGAVPAVLVYLACKMAGG